MQVFKFGGASVKDADAVRNVASILKKHVDRKTVVVISAMGKTTNALEEILTAKLNSDSSIEDLVNQFFHFHEKILIELMPKADDKTLNEFQKIQTTFIETLNQNIVTQNQFYDSLVCFGELFSTFIVSTYLNHLGIINELIDARKLIKTDS
ncbi:MAG: aspartate kinase, partial [Flavobacteriales bacterium]|nr:aspartate kinase [Flavobacteriales bacterium]